MDFFLGTGIYVLIVAMAIGGAGFVVFRLLISGRGQRRSAASGRGKKRGLVDEDDEELEDLDIPRAAAPTARRSPKETADVQKPTAEVKKPSAELPQSPDAAASSAAPDAGAPAGATTSESVDSGAAGETTNAVAGAGADVQAASTDAAAETGQSKADERAEEVGGAGTAAGPGDAAEDSSVEPGTVQQVAATPEGADDSDVADSVMAMFKASDYEDSSATGLATIVNEVAASDLLSEAVQLATTMKDWGGNDAQSQ